MTTNTIPSDHQSSSGVTLKATPNTHAETNKTTSVPPPVSLGSVTAVAIEQLLTEAKTLMLSGDYAKACETYADALEMINAENADPFRPQLAPLYYAYGLCLLNHSITQSQILGESVPENHPKEGQPELDEEKVAEELTKNKVLVFEGDYDEEEDDCESDSEKTIVEQSNDVQKEKPLSNKSSDKTGESDAEGVLLTKESLTEEEIESEKSLEKTIQLYDDLQLAWEVLDMARVIYTNHSSGDKGSSLKLSEVCLALGDVGVESENFDTAIGDYKTALIIKSQWLEKDDRSIAELHFKIACALELAGGDKQKEAIGHVHDALDLLKSRGQWIQKQLNVNSHSRSLSDETRARFEQELEDLTSLYPDLEAKIEDLKKPVVSLEEAEQTVGALLQSAVEKASSVPASSSGSAAPMDISSLIKKKEKKREGESEGVVEESATSSETIESNEKMKRQKTKESV